MRFEVSRVLDAIEGRLSTDPALARGVLDLSETVRLADLDGGRPASLLRLGMVIDTLGRLLGEENVAVYVVLSRALLSDVDLTSNERMVIRRWVDDGLVEVLPNPGERVLEVADLIGVPVLSRDRFEGLRDRYAWLTAEPGRLLAPARGAAGPVLTARVPGALRTGQPSSAPVLRRLWRCPEPDCVAFGPAGRSAMGGPARRPGAQPPPRLRSGAPVCPRHEVRLTDVGARPAAEVLAVRIDQVVRRRFVVAEDQSAIVGRAPEVDGSSAVMLGHWLSPEARRWISRNHVCLDLRGDELSARDVSTNGTVLRPGGSMDEADRVVLTREQGRALAADDVLELYPGVQVGRARNWSSGGVADPASLMADAPTISIRSLRQ